MTIWGVYGSKGYGKNLFAVNLIKAWSDSGMKTMANFHVFKKNMPNTPYPNFSYITASDFLTFESEKDYPYRYLCVIDEPYAFGMDSRTSGSVVNRALMKKILQSRKFKMDILYVTQLNSTVDKRLRFDTNKMFFAISPSENSFNYLTFGYKRDGSLKLQFFHIDREYAREYLYPYYDTEETVDIDSDTLEEIAENYSQRRK